MIARTGTEPASGIFDTAPALRVEFEYDWQGRRVCKKAWNNTNASGAAILVEKYVYHGWNLLAAFDAANAVTKSFHWGADLSGSLQGAGGVGGLVALQLHTGANAGTYFTAYDGNGNVAGLVNAANGTWSARYEYGPFGELIRSSGAIGRDNPYRFSTKWQDDETELIYYGYRYYSAGLGRWLSRDPIGEAGFVLMTTGVQLVFLENSDDERASKFSQDRMRAELNLFASFINDPQNRIDPFGLRDCPAWAEYMCKNPPSEETREFMGTCVGVVGLFTPWPGDEGLLIGAVLPKLEKALEKCWKCTKVRCKFQRDGPHHSFVRDGKVCWMKHIRITCYIKGSKGQPPIFEFNGMPYGPCYKFKHGWGGITH